MSTSAFYTLPHRYQDDAERDDRYAAGAALCRSVLDAAEARRERVDDEPTDPREAMYRRCRELARADKKARQQRQRDADRAARPTAVPMADAVAGLVQQYRSA